MFLSNLPNFLMKVSISKISVPGFKVLRRVDFPFASALENPISAITGKNGSGKSLLLQLIFCLVTSMSNRHCLPHLQNLLGSKASDLPIEYPIARIELNLDGRVLSLEFYAIGHDLLTPLEKASVDNLASFARYQIETVSSGFYPVLYVRDEYLLTCFFGWKDGGTEGAIDNQQLAQISNQVGRSIFLVGRISDLPHMLCSDGITNEQFRLVSEELSLTAPNLLNIDKQLGFWERSSRYSCDDVRHIERFLANRQGLENCVVLIDDLDRGLDANGQFEVPSDLLLMAPSNQYLLATNSYELCQALPLKPSGRSVYEI
jgi:energy-coupling factor transporter ATP-binding protein EcfA2